MVSIEGYAVSSYIFMIVGTYVLIALLFISRLIVHVMQDKRLLLSIITTVSIGIAIYILYLFEVRIGMVMFINGMLLMRLLLDVKEMIEYFTVEDVDGTTDGYEYNY